MGPPASGKDISIAGAAFFRVLDAKIAQIRGFWDVPAFLGQAGLPHESARSSKRV